jgi:hypothetical protein
MPQWKYGVMKVAPNMASTAKMCPPFLDALTSGYVITTSCDLLVAQTDGGPTITWKYAEEFPPVENREDFLPGMSTPLGCDDHHFIWRLPTVFKVPSKYSILFTHPINRHDLPFITLSAVIDGGFTIVPGAQVPFFLKSGFTGIIPKGTPIAQLIPFRRENWVLQQIKGLIKEASINQKLGNSVIRGWYKSTHWKRKSYQ